MLHFRFSITQKVIALVAIPLVFELVFVGLLYDTIKKAAEESSKAEHALAISNTTNALIKDLFHMVSELSLNDLEERGLLKGEFKETERMIHAKMLIKRLVALTRSDPDTRRVAIEVQKMTSQSIAEFKRGWDACIRGDRETLLYVRKKGLKKYAAGLISDDLINLPKDAMERYNQARENERVFRQEIITNLFALATLSILVTILIAFGLTSQITGRLTQVARKTYLLASNEPLSKPLGGDDEIGDVDRALHSMVIALSEANYREKAALDNARDIICSIDGAGKFSAVNQASSNVLGYPCEELLGRYYIDIVASEDVNFVLKQIEAVVTEQESHEFEARVVRPNRTSVDLLWSVHWSSDERTLFCVLHDVSARKEAERLRQEVIAMVTHDLRTPLTAVRQIVEMFKEGSVGDFTPEADKMLSRIDTATTRMMLLINDLLDIEKIKSGSMQLSYSQVLASDLFSVCSDTVSALVSEKQIQLNSGEDDVELSADPDRIVQVLVNLVSNAIKFSTRGGTITLTAADIGEEVEFQIADNGRGIPEEMLEKIFDRFQQVKESDAKVKGGSGLGLAICKSLVELHGGRIWVESTEGAGSTFKFTLPRQGRSVSP